MNNQLICDRRCEFDEGAERVNFLRYEAATANLSCFFVFFLGKTRAHYVMSVIGDDNDGALSRTDGARSKVNSTPPDESSRVESMDLK